VRSFSITVALVVLLTACGSAGAQKLPLPGDGRDDRGRAVASGIYYMIVKAGGYAGRQKVTLLR